MAHVSHSRSVLARIEHEPTVTAESMSIYAALESLATGLPSWYLVVALVCMLTGAMLVAVLHLRLDPDQTVLARYRGVIGVLFLASLGLLSHQLLFLGVGWLLTTTVVGVDLAYFFFATIVVLAGAGLLVVERHTGESQGNRRLEPWNVVAFVFVAGVVLLVLYAVLSVSGWLAILTLFSDDHRAENFRAFDEIFPSAPIEAAGSTWELEKDERPLPETYHFDGEARSVEEFLERTETTGLIVAHNETIVHESYYRGYDETSRATSFSVAKSVTSTLVGIAIDDGYIDGVDDEVVTYVPTLEGSGYDGTTIRELLTMSSGVDFDEDYEATLGGINRLIVDTYLFNRPLESQMATLDRENPPGEYKNYVSTDTIVLGLVLESATGTPYEQYLEDRLWQPGGMEGDAFTTVDTHGTPVIMCCLNAQLRDYTRFGLLYLNEGTIDDTVLVPPDWVRTSTTPQPPHDEPDGRTDSFGSFEYGYKWWIPGDADEEFTAIGIYGQYVYVNKQHDTVITKTSTDPNFADNDEETIELFRAISESLTQDRSEHS